MSKALKNITKLNNIVSVLDFYANGVSGALVDPTGVVDSTLGIAAAWAASKYITFPAGTYKVSSLPNFAVNGARIETIGKVIINYTGTGNGLIVDAGAGAGVKNYDIQIGPMTINGSASATNGVYIRGITHSTFKRLRPINFPLSAMRTEFMVSNTFEDFCYSGNEAGITVPTAKGIILEKRNAGEQSSDCTFINPIIEGTTGDGIYGTEAAQCTFIGGTSEGNGTGGGAGGVYLGPNSFSNTFIGLDLENNGKAADATSYHVKNYGFRNRFITPFCDAVISGLFWVAGGNSLSIEGGQISSLQIDAGVKNTNTIGVAYSGTLTDNGTDTHHLNLYYIIGAVTVIDSNVTTGTWTPVATSLTGPGTPAYTANYQKVGKVCTFSIYMPTTGGTVTSAAGSTNFTLPFSVGASLGVAVAASNGSGAGLGNCFIGGGNRVYTPTFTDSFAVISGSYITP